MASLPLFHARPQLPHGLVYQAGFLDEAEERALLSGIATLDLVEAEYRAGTQLGWHRDSPRFGVVVGISLGTACRMRFRPHPPRKGSQTFELVLEPRSAYVLRDRVRWGWQHSIPPTPALRYSITFRTPAAVRPGRRVQ